MEGKTRFVILLRLPQGRSAEQACKALSKAIGKLPMVLRPSLAWDQGKEMALHQHFTSKTGLPLYFCDPHSPWQRGSNENTNALLRQYFPRSMDFSEISQHKLNAVAAQLNGRPRETLDWDTPAERMLAVLQ